MMLRLRHALLALALAMLALPSIAQVSGSGFAIVRAWDGTNYINVGDNANTAFRVNCVIGCSSSSSNFGAAMPAAGQAVGFSDGANMQSARVFDMDSGAGTQFGLGVNLRRTASGGSTELLGQTTMALSLPVTLASDQTALLIQTSGVATANNDGATVVATTTSGTVLASFASRKFASICSVPTNTDIVYIRLAAVATTADYPLYVGQCWNTPSGVVYTGIIDARSNTGSQTVAVMEW